MDALLTKVMGFVNQAGGRITYPQLLEQVDYPERAMLYNALRLGKSKGVLRKFVSRNAETGEMETVVEALPVPE